MHFNLTNKAAIAPTQLHQLFRLVLKGVKLIRKCGFTRNNQQPWASYINEWGQSCSHFLKKSLFAGYDFVEHGSRVVVIDKRNGATATVSLNILHCSCVAFNSDRSLEKSGGRRGNPASITTPAFRYRQPCQHIEAAKLQYPQLEQLIAEERRGKYIDEQSEEFKIGDRVIVNSWRKKVMRKLGEVKRVEDSGAVVFVEGQTLWLFYDELTRQIKTRSHVSIQKFAPQFQMFC